MGYIGSRGFSGSQGITGTLTETLSSPPSNPVNGQMWFDTEDGSLKVYYDDGDTTQWVVVSGPIGPQGEIGFVGSQGYSGSVGYSGSRGFSAQVTDTAPSTPDVSNGYLWFNSTDASLNVYYDETWVGATGPRGLRGYSGSQGNVGYTGSRGTTGFVGSTGKFHDWVYLDNTNDLYVASNLEAILADTSSASFSISLPASPSQGNTVVFADASNWSINPLTILRNGSTIEGVSDDIILDIGSNRTEFIHDGTTWQVISNIGEKGDVGYTGSQGPSADVTGKAIAMTIVFGG